jgi:hypothetical protein
MTVSTPLPVKSAINQWMLRIKSIRIYFVKVQTTISHIIRNTWQVDSHFSLDCTVRPSATTVPITCTGIHSCATLVAARYLSSLLWRLTWLTRYKPLWQIILSTRTQCYTMKCGKQYKRILGIYSNIICAVWQNNKTQQQIFSQFSVWSWQSGKPFTLIFGYRGEKPTSH